MTESSGHVRAKMQGLDRSTEHVRAPAALPVETVFLHVTKACNLRCPYCYFCASEPLTDEMRTDEFTRLWPDIVALRPRKVVFTGGEPFLRPDLLDLLHGLRRADPGRSVL